ncbi:MAG TPA: PAS domain S-box protein [Actinomycetales bacterium]|jgi:hypothetical protein
MTRQLPTVVLVDDAADVRALVRTRLRLSGRLHVVAEGSNGAEAVTLAAEHRPTLMLLDVSMPVMDGLQALPRVLEASPTTRVVLYSGFDERGLAEQGRRLGAAAFIEKSGSIDDLADRLTAVLGTRPATSSEAPAAPPASTATDTVLLEHLERFQEVFEQAAIGMATLTLTGQVVRVNRALALLLGRPADELVGTSYAEVAGGPAGSVGGQELALACDRLLGGDDDVLHVEHVLPGAGGGRVLRSTLAAVRSERRQPLYLFLQAQDVTEQRLADDVLAASEERFRLLVDAVEDYAIFMLDPQGLVVSWNAGAQRIKGYAGEAIIGRHFGIFYPPQERADGHPERELVLALRDGRYEEEGWRVRADGSRFWASVVLTAIRDEKGRHRGFAKITRDVSGRQEALLDRERAAAALAAANAELAQANDRLARAAADQSQFLAVTAHELRGPVSVLGGSADMLGAHWAELTDDERDGILGGMTSSAVRLRRLLSDLLTAARLDAGAIDMAPRPVRLSAVIDAAVRVDAASGGGDSLQVDCPPELMVLADPERLAQALENLVSNARRHGADPVVISAAAPSLPTEPGAVQRVQLRVMDGGSGVPGHVAGRLFERFATGDRYGGTGLGLFIVRELLRAQGGDARYEGPCAGPEGDAVGTHAFVLSVPAG